MSLKDFIGKSPNIINKFGSTLPIPYIETINVFDEYIDYQIAIYAHVPTVEFQKDGGVSYLLSFNDLGLHVMPIYDRNSDTHNCGRIVDDHNAPGNGSYTAADSEDYSFDAWTRVSTGLDSPLQYIAPLNSDIDNATGIITKFTLGDLSTQTELIDKIYDHFIDNATTVLTSYGISQEILVAIRDGTEVPDAAAVYAESIESSVDVEESRVSYVKTILIPQAIYRAVEANYFKGVMYLFGLKAYGYDADSPTSERIIESQIDTIVAPIEQTPVMVSSRSPLLSQKLTLAEADVGSYETMINEDGSAYVKITMSFSREGVPYASKPTRCPNPALYKTDLETGISKMGLVAFTAPWCWGDFTESQTEDIYEYYKTESGERSFWNTSISGYNHVLIAKNDDLIFEPVEVYTDENGVIYEEAMMSLDALYYAPDAVTPDTILADMLALDTSGLPEPIYNSFQYLLATSQAPMETMLPELNKYRKAFPDKSTVTPVGVFYNEFADVLFNANKILQRGKQLTKSLITNPVVKDFRNRPDPDEEAELPYLGEDYKDAYYEMFSLDNSMWSRYTEVIGLNEDLEEGYTDSYYSDTGPDGSDPVLTDEIVYGGNWYSYNFIDHAFIFFNFERALKTASYLSKYLNVTLLEKYFGQSLTNNNFVITRISVSAYFADSTEGLDGFTNVSDGKNASLIGRAKHVLSELGNAARGEDTDDAKRKVFLQYMNETNQDVNVNRDMMNPFVDNSTETPAESNELITLRTDWFYNPSEDEASWTATQAYGGADGMVNSREYSYVTQRGYVPITIQDHDPNPLLMDHTFLTEREILYRQACFEYQKCDRFHGEDFKNTEDYARAVVREIEELNRGGCFRTQLLVKDSTNRIVLSLYQMFRDHFEEFQKYAAAALDTCSYNEETGYFNEFFVSQVMETFPSMHEAPWVEGVVLLVILEDILFNTYSGGDISISKEMETLAYTLSPETGTVSGIEDYRDRVQRVMDRLEELLTDFEISVDATIDSVPAAGHVFGCSPKRCADYEDAKSHYQAFAQSTAARVIDGDLITSTGNKGAWSPGVGYDNYPLFPEQSSYTYRYILEDPDAGMDETCFVAGTVVLMADGSVKNIEDVLVGDVLLGENGAHNKVLDLDRVPLGNRQLYSINGGRPFVTGDHPFRSVDGWKAIYPVGTEHIPRKASKIMVDYYGEDGARDHGVETTQLLEEDILIRIGTNGEGASAEEVKSIVAHDSVEQILYNFFLDGNHTYYADGYLVHNFCAEEEIILKKCNVFVPGCEIVLAAEHYSRDACLAACDDGSLGGDDDDAGEFEAPVDEGLSTESETGDGSGF